MGVIQRQGIKNSIVNYLGAAIGMLSTLFVYKQAIEAYGLVQYLKSTALLFIPLANWGIQSLTIKFFPTFKTRDGKNHGFLSFLFIASSLAFLLFALVVFIFWDQIHHYFQMREAEMEQSIPITTYIWYFVPLVYLLILVNILTNYISNFQRIVWPAILHDLFLKILLPVLILLFAAQVISLDWVVRIFILAYIFIVGFLMLYLLFLGELRFSTPDSKVWKQLQTMADFAGFSMLGTLGGVLALQLDTFMLGTLTTFRNAGIYNLAIFITMAIGIPQRSIMNISAPIVSDRWQSNDRKHIAGLYKQTSILLLMVGIFLLIEIAFNFPDLCALIPKAEPLLAAYPIILILGFGRIVDMGTSINGHIIQYSSKYRLNIYFILFLGGLNILLNAYLVPRYEMMGAAVATAFSLAAYNVLRTVFVYRQFDMHPFSKDTLRLLVVGGITTGLAFLLPQSSSPLFNLIYRGLIIALVFIGLAYQWKVSDDFNRTFDKVFYTIGKYLGGKR